MRTSSAAEVEDLLASAASRGQKVLARGLGRSYGDAAQCAGGLVIDATALDGIIDSDLAAGWVRVEAGVSLDTLMRWLLPKGWWVPVSPGTRHVTVGGAVASDVHGKNHHRDGSFCRHVESLKLATPTGTREVGARVDPDVFWAAAGGMGLTGVILEATIRLVPVETTHMVVDSERTLDIEDCMVRLCERDDDYRYSVAWIDTLARGRRMGRAVITRANHADSSDLERRSARDPLAFAPRVRFRVPVTAPSRLLNPLTVKALNEAWYHKTPSRVRRQIQGISGYFHPLDAVGSWNRLYGPRGLVQYQFVVPFEAERTIFWVLERLSTQRVPSFLTVLKRFGPSDPGPLSFPAAGWTLAIDIPGATPSLARILDELDVVVADAGGRVYLSKDSRLRPELLAAMYPRLAEWQVSRRRLDPDDVMVSDLGRRLGVVSVSTPSENASQRQLRARDTSVRRDAIDAPLRVVSTQ